MRLAFVLLVGALLSSQPAAADLLNLFPNEGWRGPYAGVGINGVHHTGYNPNRVGSVEQYAIGGKVFAGYRYLPWVQIEAAYHNLGAASFKESFPTSSRERSQALAVSLIYVSPSISIPFPTYLLLRTGLAYKHIRHTSELGTATEGVIASVVGIALETMLTTSVFARFEYEFISRAFGGTAHVINVMHTPLSFTLGMQF